jgi:hypothetical protein
MSIYSEHGVVLEPVRKASGPEKHDIYDAVARFGIQLAELIAHDVKVAPPLSEVPLTLSSNRIVEIVKNVIRK